MNLKDLEYPFDPEYIIKKKKSIRRRLLEDDTSSYTDIRIAVLGGYTTDDIKKVLELFLLNYGIRPEFYESEYNQFYQDAVFDNAEMESFAPDLVYVCTSNRKITTYPALSDTREEVDVLLAQEAEKYHTIWEHISEKYHCTIIQNNFEMPSFRLLGNKDASDIHGRVNFLSRLNQRFNEYAQTHDNFYICDINYISADYGLQAWSDPFYWYMYKYAVAVPAIPYLSFNVANIIKSVLGKNKKGIVLDLDNTLWGGVVGDDGVDGIVIGPEESEGQAYLDFQRYLKLHEQLGVILNIDSKNDYENAIAGLDHPDGVLKKDDFIEIKANWEPKDRNFIDIANDLNLLPESLVFVDDNPAERHIVESNIPGVSAPDISDVTYYIQTLDRSGFFEVTTISADDTKRNEMYRENARRAMMQSSYSDYGEYLCSLDMHAVIRPFEPVYYARIAQLSNKSNQFNVTTRRYTQTEIEQIASDDSYITLYGKLIDRFGDNGVVSVVIGHLVGTVCQVDLWIMSCRVLKRDMEKAMMDKLVHVCRKKDISRIHGYYYPTAKNHMVSELFGSFGFQKIKEDNAGNTEWIFDISDDYTDQNQVINVEE